MFKVKDYIMYGSTGVCQIVDIRNEKCAGSGDTEYYILQPVYNNSMIIKTPVNNQKVFMRETITKADVLSLIATIPETETMWINNDKQRSENFKAALRTGKSEECIKVIMTIYLEKKEKTAVGKKLTKIDEDIMEAAEKQLYEEFAIALNISPGEVVSYILERQCDI